MILDRFRLDDRVALVSGTSRGLGQGAAIALAEAGADVALLDRGDASATVAVRAFANEWAASGVTVNAIAPGYMATDNTAELRTDAAREESISTRIPMGRWGTPPVSSCGPSS